MTSLASRFRNSSTLKLITILFITLTMTIPVSMVESTIHERTGLKHHAETSISARWGGEQHISAPVLVVPYREKIVENTVGNNGWHTREPVPEKRIRYVDHVAYMLADKVHISSVMATETRYFGIYEMPVYTSRTRILGHYSKDDLNKLEDKYPNIEWTKARLVLPVEDVRGIREISELTIADKKLDFIPSTHGDSQLPGVEAAIELDNPGQNNLSFSLEINLSGSKQLNYLPLARTSLITLESDWSSPSFTGSYLPIERNIDASGFQAEWKILGLNRSFGQNWRDNNVDEKQIKTAAFGISLYQPADLYQQNTRSVKYAVLFIALTFMAFFLFEIFYGLRLHPVQYFFTGGALSTFYLLLLALSEHINFSIAYLISSISITILMSGYSMAILKQRSRGLLVGIMTAIIYSFLFFLVQSEQNSLLFGSIGFFAALSLMMYLTRNIDWYQLKSGTTDAAES